MLTSSSSDLFIGYATGPVKAEVNVRYLLALIAEGCQLKACTSRLQFIAPVFYFVVQSVELNGVIRKSPNG
jgi:hypothetical protein